MVASSNMDAELCANVTDFLKSGRQKEGTALRKPSRGRAGATLLLATRRSDRDAAPCLSLAIKNCSRHTRKQGNPPCKKEVDRRRAARVGVAAEVEKVREARQLHRALSHPRLGRGWLQWAVHRLHPAACKPATKSIARNDEFDPFRAAHRRSPKFKAPKQSPKNFLNRSPRRVADLETEE